MTEPDANLEGLRASHDAEISTDAATIAGGGRALCLSGGGYRAAIFHLGAMLRLQELNLLADLKLVSAVSGGSIVTAWLMFRYHHDRRAGEGFEAWCRRIDFRATVVEPFCAITARDIRTGPWMKTVPWNWLLPSMRVRLLERAYARFLGAMQLTELPDEPRVVFCATNLTFGVNWEYSKQRVGDYLSGYLQDGSSIPLAQAVAASSCFPPVFGPVVLKRPASAFAGGRHVGADADHLRTRIELTDGGVYDNLGTEPALRRYGQVLISDGGAPFPFIAGGHTVRRLLRYTEVIGNQAGALRRRLFFILRQHGTFSGSYWSLAGSRDAGSDGYSPALISDVLGRVRTDLDRFSPAEFQVLVNHGYFSCQDALTRAGLLPEAAAPADWPYPGYAEEERVRHALRQSHRRLVPSRWVRSEKLKVES